MLPAEASLPGPNASVLGNRVSKGYCADVCHSLAAQSFFIKYLDLLGIIIDLNPPTSSRFPKPSALMHESLATVPRYEAGFQRVQVDFIVRA